MQFNSKLDVELILRKGTPLISFMILEPNKPILLIEQRSKASLIKLLNSIKNCT